MPSDAHNLRATPLAANAIPGFELLEAIGAGGKGRVYKARQISLNRVVAIKVLHAKLKRQSQQVEKLIAEARAAATLNHPHIVQAYDIGSTDTFHYFVMEFVGGSTVSQYLASHKRYSQDEAIRIARQVADALQHAHGQNLIHCDVKPGNILIDEAGVAKLADFGVARMAAATSDESGDGDAAGFAAGSAAGSGGSGGSGGGPFGTALYGSPEQFRGQPVDARSDLYSLGATLYHMVTGRPPFAGTSLKAVIRGHIAERLTPPDQVNPQLSLGLCQVIETLLCKAPAQRYARAELLVQDLDDLLAGREPTHAGQASPFTALGQMEASAKVETLSWSERMRPSYTTLVWLLVISLLANLALLVLWLAGG